ncbi:hypothetical protein J2Z57_000800 [Formosa algae]|uniref:DUF4177 domain-containing protein n=1 Tax=Formosa algae TaxID=225843 RepID=A0A9X0YJU2_9FLAO|nr:hypothetical protein [Formosa algae]MBP1838238.1 hypothetical protein [Formosa algae]MDQ0334373.1 hypothetical protein [Formosa algae]
MIKKLLFILLFFIGLNAINAQVEYKIITSIESIVPNGLGRSRLISSDEERDFENYTTAQTEEDNNRNKSKRSDLRVKNYEETKLLNFYNIGGIRFQNIASNDVLVSSKINTMTEAGWELAFVTSAVESDSGTEDGQGIFITRYIFKRTK